MPQFPGVRPRGSRMGEASQSRPELVLSRQPRARIPCLQVGVDRVSLGVGDRELAGHDLSHAPVEMDAQFSRTPSVLISARTNLAGPTTVASFCRHTIVILPTNPGNPGFANVSMAEETTSG